MLFTDAQDGPLPGYLLLLTLTTGIADAVTILGLGKVLSANRTGTPCSSGWRWPA